VLAGPYAVWARMGHGPLQPHGAAWGRMAHGAACMGINPKGPREPLYPASLRAELEHRHDREKRSRPGNVAALLARTHGVYALLCLGGRGGGGGGGARHNPYRAR
jgi:hypothetical protein